MARLLLEAKYAAGKQIMNTPQNGKTIQNVATCHWQAFYSREPTFLESKTKIEAESTHMFDTQGR